MAAGAAATTEDALRPPLYPDKTLGAIGRNVLDRNDILLALDGDTELLLHVDLLAR